MKMRMIERPCILTSSLDARDTLTAIRNKSMNLTWTLFTYPPITSKAGPNVGDGQQRFRQRVPEHYYLHFERGTIPRDWGHD
jgi:hypothetical protein